MGAITRYQLPRPLEKHVRILPSCADTSQSNIQTQKSPINRQNRGKLNDIYIPSFTHFTAPFFWPSIIFIYACGKKKYCNMITI